MFCHVTLPICFERFDWSLAIDYLVSTNMVNLLWTFEDEKCNTSNVILFPAEFPHFWYKLLMLTMSAYCFTHAFHSHGICQEFEKKWTGRIVSNSLLLQEVTCCYKRLWKFSVTEPLCYKDVFVNSFCSPTFRLANSLVLEPFLWLII